MIQDDYLRLQKNIPTTPPPPKGFVDLRYSQDSQSLVTVSEDGTEAPVGSGSGSSAAKEVANAAARLALSLENAQGFAVVEADTGKSWMLVDGGTPSTSGDWLQLGDRDITAADIEDPENVVTNALVVDAIEDDPAAVQTAAELVPSTGGNGAADSGKVIKFNANGGISLGSITSDAAAIYAISRNGSAAVNAVSMGTSFCYEASLQADNQIGYSVHVLMNGQTGMAIDGTGGTNSTGLQCNLNGAAVKAQDEWAAEMLWVNCDGTIQFWNGLNSTKVGTLALTGNQTVNFANLSGVVLLTNSTTGKIPGSYADDAAAATAGVPVGMPYHTVGVVKVRLS